jgi:hypothetical protein
MKRIEIELDPGALPPMPWRVYLEDKGNSGEIIDSNFERVGTISATRRDDLRTIANIIEALTWAAAYHARPIERVETPAGAPVGERRKGGQWWKFWRRGR